MVEYRYRERKVKLRRVGVQGDFEYLCNYWICYFVGGKVMAVRGYREQTTEEMVLSEMLKDLMKKEVIQNAKWIIEDQDRILDNVRAFKEDCETERFDLAYRDDLGELATILDASYRLYIDYMVEGLILDVKWHKAILEEMVKRAKDGNLLSSIREKIDLNEFFDLLGMACV